MGAELVLLRDYSHLPVMFVRDRQRQLPSRGYSLCLASIAVDEDRSNEAFLAESLPLIGQPMHGSLGRND